MDTVREIRRIDRGWTWDPETGEPIEIIGLRMELHFLSGRTWAQHMSVPPEAWGDSPEGFFWKILRGSAEGALMRDLDARGDRQRAMLWMALNSPQGLVIPWGGYLDRRALRRLEARGVLVPATGFPDTWRLP